MDIRTKLVFAYVAVALGCMLALGAATYVEVRGLLRANTLEHLQGLADSKEEALEIILGGWRERVALIASRTQLRNLLRSHNRGVDDASGAQIRDILGDAVQSSAAVTLAAVYGASGRLVEWAGDQPHRAADRVPETLELQRDGITFEGAVPVAGSGPRLSFLAPLELDGAVEGTLLVELTGAELARLAAGYDEFGETGEALVVTRTGPQTAAVLHPVRHAQDNVLSIQLGDPSDDPFARALTAEEGAVWVDVTDYRGEVVWAASRSLPDTGWGLVVKVDKAQEEAPIAEFRGRLARVGLSLSAFAILLATVLGLRFAKPIQDLAGVASEIRDGRMSARATEDREDEVGLLARTFNEMASELERRMASLQEFKKFFDVSLDMLCVAGTDGFFKRTNPSFGRVLGWSDEELLQRPFLDIVHPEDIEATQREIQKLSQGIPTVSFANRFQCADGTYKRLLWTSYPEPETGLLYAIAHEVVDRSDERS